MREKVLEVLQKSCPEVDFMKRGLLVTDGILDSISLVEIISALNAELGIALPYEEIVPENFDSLDALVSLAEKYS